jgi:hypothetical protein
VWQQDDPQQHHDAQAYGTAIESQNALARRGASRPLAIGSPELVNVARHGYFPRLLANASESALPLLQLDDGH